MGLTTNVIRGNRAERLLVLIHGLGSDERDLGQLLTYLDPDGAFVALMPRGPYSAPPGYAWFQFGGSTTLVSGTMRSSMEALDETIDSACDQYGTPRRDAVIGGFSQGCMLALALSLRKGGPDKPAGVLGMSGALPPPEGIEYDWGNGSLPPVLLQHGTHDPLIPVTRARQTAETLAQHDVPVVYREYAMEHQVSLESVRDAKAWLDRVRAGERPNEPLRAPPPGDELISHVSSATFDTEVLQSTLPVVVDFWAPWCAPCRQVEPVVRQMATMRKGRYKFAKVNIDECQDIAQRYQVQSIPLVALFRNGRLERRSLGAKPRQQLEAELGMLVIP